MELNLVNKNIVITGGANGLCFDIAKAYYDAGGNICIMDIAPNISDSAKSIEKDRRVKFHQCDLSDIDTLDKEYSVVRDLCGGKIDVLFNGAGIQYREKAEDFPLFAGKRSWTSISMPSLLSPNWLAETCLSMDSDVLSIWRR